MTDKQFSAFLLFAMVAFALYLNNSPSGAGYSSRLGEVVAAIMGKGAGTVDGQVAPLDLTGVLKKNGMATGAGKPLGTLSGPVIEQGGNWLSVSPGYFTDFINAQRQGPF